MKVAVIIEEAGPISEEGFAEREHVEGMGLGLLVTFAEQYAVEAEDEAR
ncbi:MAG: hypothetical protein NT157_04000 [Candidatus Micrarchaeota archaeon]|nr:hypothetical protein [Candidatus Micrarchaeota archaeon]